MRFRARTAVLVVSSCVGGCSEPGEAPLLVEEYDPGYVRINVTETVPGTFHELKGEMTVEIHCDWMRIELEDDGVYVVPRERVAYAGPLK